MIKEITIYEANGVRFDNLEAASKYEDLCDDIERIMSRLNPRPKEAENGVCFVKQNVEILKSCFSDFCILCSKFFSDNEKWFVEVTNGDRHISHIERIIHERDFKCMSDAFSRFECMDFETGYEFVSPYYAKLEAMRRNKTYQPHEEHCCNSRH